MKTRIGFVSNSSSQSFLVASKNKELPTIKIELTVPVEKEIKTVKELKKHFDEHYEYDPDDPEEQDSWEAESYKKAVEALNRGDHLYWVETGSGQALYDYMENEYVKPTELDLPGCEVIN